MRLIFFSVCVLLLPTLSAPFQTNAQQPRKGTAPKAQGAGSTVRFDSGHSALGIPLDIDNNIIRMEVSVNHSKPLKFIFDTGVEQDEASTSSDQELSLADLLKLRGRVLAKGSNLTPTGKLRLMTYRIEEVALPHPLEVEIRGKKERVTHAFRVTITGGPFPVRALPPVIWIGDMTVGYGVENEELSEITAVTFDSSLFRDDASLYLSYGDKENKADRAELPEKLKMNAAKGERQ
jgi:hypothetical protein